jgi:L-alanine-DL-glutamate epimerase-like enolase superfamily enzyme
MYAPTRREFLASAAATSAALLAPVRAVAAAAKPVRIRNVEIFPIDIATPEEELRAGKYARYTFYLVDTDVGVRGYAFDRESDFRVLDTAIRPALVGKDLFAIEDHLRNGLAQWAGVEQAIWDAIGKIAGQPVYRLLGGGKTRLKVYLTVVWRGNADQSQVTYDQQAATAAALKKAGYKGMKIRAWRPNPIDDASACGEIRRAVGPDFAIMVDRTAHLPGLWDYATGLQMARALEKHNVLWLEEPFSRDDFFSHARLAREVDILITGGERFHGLDPNREALVHHSYDLLQPDTVIAGGIFMVRKIAALAQAFHIPVVLHGSMGLRLAGWLQASAAIGASWQELALITPPLLPEEQWSPALKVLRTRTLFQIRDGEIEVPQAPGLGLDVDEEAVRSFRVPEPRSFYPQYEGEGRGQTLTLR